MKNTIKVLFALAALAACSDDNSDGAAGDSAAGAGAGASGGAAASGAAASGAGSGAGSGASGSAADPNQPAAPGVPPTFIPNFPGSGTSGDDAPLTNGELCDYVPLDGAPTPNEITTCFFTPGDPQPVATMEQVLECVDGSDVVHIRLTFNPTFVDNTYGVNAIGWAKGNEDMMMDPMMDPMMMMKPPKGRGRMREYKQLVGSDHAEIVITDDSGEKVAQFKLDYISEDASSPSGYGDLGVLGGDGEMILGDASWVLDTETSIDRNLNERGYGSYIVDSPATDEDYTPNTETPEWDYRYVFEAWIDVAALGNGGFGTALIEHVHASPAKSEEDTLIVEPGECPPCDPTQPDAQCDPGDPPDEPPGDGVCDGTELDTDCVDGGAPPPTDVCDDPMDPRCNVD